MIVTERVGRGRKRRVVKEVLGDFLTGYGAVWEVLGDSSTGVVLLHNESYEPGDESVKQVDCPSPPAPDSVSPSSALSTPEPPWTPLGSATSSAPETRWTCRCSCRRCESSCFVVWSLWAKFFVEDRVGVRAKESGSCRCQCAATAAGMS